MFLLRFRYGETSERPPRRSLGRRRVGRFRFCPLTSVRRTSPWKVLICRLLAQKNVDQKLKPGLDRPHENKNNWIDSGVLLFGRGSVFCRRPADGQLEAERGQIKIHTRDAEEYRG